MFGFTKRHEHEWRIRRLEENDKTMLSTLNEIKLGQKTQEQVNIKLDKTIDNSIVQVLIMPFLYANTYYSIDQLIDAYKKKMKRNHERQDGTADAGNVYV
ncbi:DUF2951 family protein (plasmid) [Staphylococcus aureus]|nr:DUF2951 family protein [Staphylococcus aureus]